MRQKKEKNNVEQLSERIHLYRIFIKFDNCKRKRSTYGILIMYNDHRNIYPHTHVALVREYKKRTVEELCEMKVEQRSVQFVSLQRQMNISI